MAKRFIVGEAPADAVGALRTLARAALAWPGRPKLERDAHGPSAGIVLQAYRRSRGANLDALLRAP